MKISIIVPVYNVEKYLERALESIRAQTVTEYEAVLVDDGSTDGSGAICDAYTAKDSRFRVIHRENGGLSKAQLADLRGLFYADDHALWYMTEAELRAQGVPKAGALSPEGEEGESGEAGEDENGTPGAALYGEGRWEELSNRM